MNIELRLSAVFNVESWRVSNVANAEPRDCPSLELSGKLARVYFNETGLAAIAYLQRVLNDNVPANANLSSRPRTGAEMSVGRRESKDVTAVVLINQYSLLQLVGCRGACQCQQESKNCYRDS